MCGWVRVCVRETKWNHLCRPVLFTNPLFPVSSSSFQTHPIIIINLSFQYHPIITLTSSNHQLHLIILSFLCPPKTTWIFFKHGKQANAMVFSVPKLILSPAVLTHSSKQTCACAECWEIQSFRGISETTLSSSTRQSNTSSAQTKGPVASKSRFWWVTMDLRGSSSPNGWRWPCRERQAILLWSWMTTRRSRWTADFNPYSAEFLKIY